MRKIEDAKMLAKILRQAREKEGLTQFEAAKLCDVGFRTYQRIENCELAPKLSTIMKISSAFESSILKKFIYYLDGKDNVDQNLLPSLDACLLELKYKSEASLFSPFEVNGIKRILSEGKIKNLSRIGYWEVNTVSGEGYWCRRMLELYFSDSYEKGILSKRISSNDLEVFFDAFDSLTQYGIPLSLNHQVRHHNVHHEVHREDRKLRSETGDLFVYGIAYDILDASS